MKVIGHAGCGKTTWIINHLSDLIKKNKWDTSRYIVVTFSKAAVADFKIRSK